MEQLNMCCYGKDGKVFCSAIVGEAAVVKVLVPSAPLNWHSLAAHMLHLQDRVRHEVAN